MREEPQWEAQLGRPVGTSGSGCPLCPEQVDRDLAVCLCLHICTSRLNGGSIEHHLTGDLLPSLWVSPGVTAQSEGTHAIPNLDFQLSLKHEQYRHPDRRPHLNVGREECRAATARPGGQSQSQGGYI